MFGEHFFTFYFLYNGFEVPMLLCCSQSPFSNTVDCYIAKATEKKIFLYIMGCILCLTQNSVELLYIIWNQVVKCVIRQYTPMEKASYCRQPPVSIPNTFVPVEPEVTTEGSPT